MTTDWDVNLSTAPTISVLRRDIAFFTNLQKLKQYDLTRINSLPLIRKKICDLIDKIYNLNG